MPEVQWLVMGDFDVILNMEERSDFCSGWPLAENVKEFHECIHDVKLSDICSIGPNLLGVIIEALYL